MGIQVVATAQLMCSFGVAPSALTVVPKGKPVQAGGMMAATIQDFAPNVNIMP
ncbi:MAG: PAAR-like protein, partial [Ilumatobacteraceae bacterium]